MMLSSTLPLFLAIFCLSLSGSFAVEVVFSSNASSVEIGHPVKLTCELKNYELENRDYGVFFYANDLSFFYYNIQAPGRSGQRSISFVNLTSAQPDLVRRPLSSNFPLYEITVTPTSASTKEYSCLLWRASSTIRIVSKSLSITATPPPPPAKLDVVFSSNASSVEIGRLVTLRCELKNYELENRDYEVYFIANGLNFFNYHIKAPDRSGQRSISFVNLTSAQPDLVRKPFSSNFPIYEIAVTPTSASTKEYRCLLWRASSTVKTVSKSLSITATPPSTKLEAVLSINATSVEIGHQIKLTCELKNYELENRDYRVYFYANDLSFFYYNIQAPDRSGKRSISFVNLTSAQPDLVRKPLSSNFPVYEIIVTPTSESKKEYNCLLWRASSTITIASKNLSITATPPPPPTALISSNVTAPFLASPFTLSCSFAHFNPLPVKYWVTFNSLHNGQLAVYEVSKERTLLAAGINEKVDVSQGPRSTYPNFDLLITERVDDSSAYWCTLEEAGKAPVVSNTWPRLVQFTASKPAVNQRAATCSVGATGLEPSGKEYTVMFFSDLGPKSVNLLAKYSFKPNQREEFRSAHVTSWGTIHFGASTSWPNFSILANGTGALQEQGTWWCALVVGAQGSTDFRVFTSDKATL